MRSLSVDKRGCFNAFDWPLERQVAPSGPSTISVLPCAPISVGVGCVRPRPVAEMEREYGGIMANALQVVVSREVL
jgi:hypothetical protein